MGLVNLDVFPRSQTGKNANRRTRAAGRIPAVVYGKDRQTDLVELDAHKFNVALFRLAGRTALFALGTDDPGADGPIGLERSGARSRNSVSSATARQDDPRRGRGRG